jgi:hypothetical protein
MKHVVSVSLGSSKRNKASTVEFLGESFKIERVGTDGDTGRFVAMFRELDGKVDALGVGGADIYVVVGGRKYAFKQVQKWISEAKQTPVVDGSGLKHTLERRAIYYLQEAGILDFSKETVLLVSAVDRFGMIEALNELCPRIIAGDILFGLGLPIPLRSYFWVQVLGTILLPIVTHLPIKWFYPTGEKQEQRTPKWESIFNEASVIAGDWHYIKRYVPENTLYGKTIITQTLRKSDMEWLEACKVQRIITTTPVIQGETFATNVMEAVLLTLLDKDPKEITEVDYIKMLEKLAWKPNVIDFERNRATVRESNK